MDMGSECHHHDSDHPGLKGPALSRALTDAESRARGVGPECSKLFDFLHQFVRSKVDGVPLAEVVERAA